MTDLFISLGAWNWLVAGFVLMALALQPSWQAQILLFALFAVAAVPLWRRLARGGGGEAQATDPFLNRRTEALVGREFTLDKPIEGGVGTVRIDDTVWRVFGPDAPAGSRVRIVQVDGVKLTVAGV